MVGDKYLNATGLSCKFGDEAGPAEFVSPSLITCRSPYSRRGSVALEVSNNAVVTPQLQPLNPEPYTLNPNP